jgi:uncharacterized protein (TIRG00374 family)
VKEQAGAVREKRDPASYVPVRPHWIGWAFLLGLLLFGAMFFFADAHKLWQTLSDADVWLLPLPVLCVIASYLTMARSYQGIGRAAGYDVSMREMLKITFVANSLNYIVATGGLSGFAARMYFFTRLSIPSGTAVIISLAQTFMTNVTLLFFVIAGFGYLFTSHTLQGSALVVTSILLAFFATAALVASLLLLHPRLRRRTLFVFGQASYWVMRRLLAHRAPARTHIWRYQFNLNRGIAFLLSRKRQMVGPLAYIIFDWMFTLLILHTSFLAVRYPIRLSFVIVGFAVGIVLSLASLIPGGLGIMEGSMAAVFASLGVPFETAVVAVLLFRAIYYLLPLLFSLFFLHGMFVQGSHVGDELAAGDPPAHEQAPRS